MVVMERPCSNILHDEHTRIPDQQRDCTDKRAESSHSHKNYFKNRSTITQAGSQIAIWPVLRMTSPARTLLAHLTRAPDLQGQALWIGTTSECIQESILSVVLHLYRLQSTNLSLANVLGCEKSYSFVIDFISHKTRRKHDRGVTRVE